MVHLKLFRNVSQRQNGMNGNPFEGGGEKKKGGEKKEGKGGKKGKGKKKIPEELFLANLR